MEIKLRISSGRSSVEIFSKPDQETDITRDEDTIVNKWKVHTNRKRKTILRRKE